MKIHIAFMIDRQLSSSMRVDNVTSYHVENNILYLRRDSDDAVLSAFNLDHVAVWHVLKDKE